MITASESSAINRLQGKGDVSVMSVSFSGYYLMEFHCIMKNKYGMAEVFIFALFIFKWY